MPTLIEELKKAEENQQKQEELKQAIIKFVEQPNIHNTLKKGASKGINASINKGYTWLMAKDYATELERLGYLFLMDTPDKSKSLLTAHIDLLNDGASVYIEHYDNNKLTKEHVLQALESIIGLEDE